MADAVQSWNMPRTVCSPLKRMCDPTRGPPLLDLAAVHGDDEERMILQCSDLQVGFAAKTMSVLQCPGPDWTAVHTALGTVSDCVTATALVRYTCMVYTVVPLGLRHKATRPQPIVWHFTGTYNSRCLVSVTACEPCCSCFSGVTL